ncbi:cold shock domain-containing protein [Ramlibacter tataouinensis]|uniref:cold shock domain-containing protein n=1 Tax=Ramlibacter tataouinensis TaxID=94132 RepID=UPI0009EEA8B1|nr:cold shock domain-containing protein [Ramlibacter tataouinensis]
MPQTGILRTWNDDRGFGFIAPTQGGCELFVHISAFPRDGSRPTVGERLTYELGRGKDGQPQAIQVFRNAIGRARTDPRTRANGPRRARSRLPATVAVVLLVGIGAFGYSRYVRQSQQAQPLATSVSKGIATTESVHFRCDGRTHCSQMTSCAEAKFFLANCPGTKMDGNNDGVPCEQQWCTSPLAQ